MPYPSEEAMSDAVAGGAARGRAPLSRGWCLVVVVPLSEHLERSHESSAWFWRQGVGLGRSTRRAVDIRVYVMLMAGWAGSGQWLLGPLFVCPWCLLCGSVGKPVSRRCLVSEFAVGCDGLGEQGPLRLQQKRQ